MYPKRLQTLIEMLAKLPGVGPRQAARMAFFILREPSEYAATLSATLKALKIEVGACRECFRATELIDGESSGLCSFCANSSRDHGQICILEKEVDIPTFERSGLYRGLYHILGGTFSALDPKSPERLRLGELYKRIERLAKERPLEIIIATSHTSEGDATALYIERILEPLQKNLPSLVISRLGRGLSAGTELEYADEITLQHALTSRIKA